MQLNLWYNAAKSTNDDTQQESQNAQTYLLGLDVTAFL